MSDSDILERAKAIHEKYASRDESIDEVFQAHLAADLLPELIAEVERRRAALAHELDLRDRHIESLEARIKELEADRIEARAQYLLFMNDNPGCIAWNFDELDETEQDALREQARYMLELEEPWAYIQLRKAREQIKRLEAALQDSLAARLYYEHYPGVSDAYSWHDYPEDACHCMPKEKFREKAHEALERIKAETGSGDHVAGANKLILTAEQREALCRTLNLIGNAISQNETSDHPGDCVLETSGLRNDYVTIEDLLSGSKPSWKITEERQEALRAVLRAVRDEWENGDEYPRPIEPEEQILWAMLEEAKRDA